MGWKASYLRERIYRGNQSVDTDQSKMEQWNKLIGKINCERLQERHSNYPAYIRNQIPEKECRYQESELLDYLQRKQNRSKNIYSIICEGIHFMPFYSRLLAYGRDKLEQMMSKQKETVSEGVFGDFTNYLAEQLQELCLRTLIAKLHEYKDKGKLEGADDKEEYCYFCSVIAVQLEFMGEVFEEYPVLCRCVEERITYTVEYYTEILMNYQKDREFICNGICEGIETGGICRIKGNFSDVHHNGRQVMRVGLESGTEILYKPHDMENEKAYAEMLKWLAIHTGIAQYEYGFVSCSDHAWSSIVAYDTCHSKEALSRYYTRLGVQLFLAYLLGTKDLHCENLIAAGEYPVLIDLETLSNIHYNGGRKSAEEEIYYQLAQSVLYTGILPYYSWNKEDAGINCSAISAKAGQKYPFRIPVIRYPGTSKMCIAYEQPSSMESQNLATLKGNYENPCGYLEELQKGFTIAYERVLEHKVEFEALLGKLERLTVRYVLADTQRYSMLLGSSYHPSLLRDGADREIFLYSMGKGRKDEEWEIVVSEVRELLNGDVPYFDYRMDSCDLRSMSGGKIKGYFQESALHIIREKLENLDRTDMEIQCDFMELSLRMTQDKEHVYINKIYPVDRKRLCPEQCQKDREKNKNWLKQRLLSHAVWNRSETEVSWYTVQLAASGSGTWNIRPMNPYLYEGLAGMLLLAYQLTQKSEEKEIIKLYRTLRNMLFRYTNRVAQSIGNACSASTGAYEGEGSIAYSYLLLYQESGEKLYLQYARKHAQVLGRLIEADCQYDLLSGNAGAAWVLLQLYDICRDSELLNMARRAIDILRKAAIKMNPGIGWVVEEETPPMAGMAHGNAGILMPVLWLWQITGEESYAQMAEDVWQYENFLYDSEIMNWRDTRLEDQKLDACGPVAWCHGAPGILLARMRCIKRISDQRWRDRLALDMERAYGKLSNFWKRDSWSLCHGICGNLWILKLISEWKGENVNCDIMTDYRVRLLPQERLCPGLMNGYGGILYYFLLNY